MQRASESARQEDTALAPSRQHAVGTVPQQLCLIPASPSAGTGAQLRARARGCQGRAAAGCCLLPKL